MVSVGDESPPSIPLVPFRFPSGGLTVTVRKPDGTTAVLGPTPFVQARSTSLVNRDGALLDFDHRDVRVSQAILANSRQTFLVADHSKFGRNAMARVGNLAEMDAFFTDAPPPPAIGALIAAAGVRLHVAQASTSLPAAEA